MGKEVAGQPPVLVIPVDDMTAEKSGSIFAPSNSVGLSACPFAGPSAADCGRSASILPSNRTARVIFCIAQGRMVLLHSFIKKTQKTPQSDLELARKRQKEIEQ